MERLTDRYHIEDLFYHKGYVCAVVFQRGGHRCGYVSLPKNNPYFGKNYDDIPISCHGGLTYARSTLAGISGEGWWIGFDCGHAGDARDHEAMRKYFEGEYIEAIIGLEERFPFLSDMVRTFDYVKNGCKRIVEQLVDTTESEDK